VEQLDMLTIGNIVQVSRFYAHAVIAYCFFGMLLRTPIMGPLTLDNLRLHPFHDIA
jgi:hypothetical protein